MGTNLYQILEQPGNQNIIRQMLFRQERSRLWRRILVKFRGTARTALAFLGRSVRQISAGLRS
jgi:hypothetical protein